MMILSPLLLVFSKLSLLFFYRRIFATSGFRRINDGFIIVIICWCISLLFTTIFACDPVSAVWEDFIWVLPKKCINMTILYNYISISDTVTDLAILILPIPMTIKLHLPMRERIALTGVFLMGTL